MDALVIKDNWLEKIFAGEKDWEIRGTNTIKRGTIKLIQSGSGLVVGQADIINSRDLNKKIFDLSLDRHRVSGAYHDLPYSNPHYWELTNCIKYDKPIKYRHPQGAIIWVKDIESKEYHDDTIVSQENKANQAGLEKE